MSECYTCGYDATEKDFKIADLKKDLTTKDEDLKKIEATWELSADDWRRAEESYKKALTESQTEILYLKSSNIYRLQERLTESQAEIKRLEGICKRLEEGIAKYSVQLEESQALAERYKKALEKIGNIHVWPNEVEQITIGRMIDEAREALEEKANG